VVLLPFCFFFLFLSSIDWCTLRLLCDVMILLLFFTDVLCWKMLILFADWFFSLLTETYYSLDLIYWLDFRWIFVIHFFLLFISFLMIEFILDFVLFHDDVTNNGSLTWFRSLFIFQFVFPLLKYKLTESIYETGRSMNDTTTFILNRCRSSPQLLFGQFLIIDDTVHKFAIILDSLKHWHWKPLPGHPLNWN